MKKYDEILDGVAEEQGMMGFADARKLWTEDAIVILCKEAAERYAKERSIAFAEWAGKRYAYTMQKDWMDMEGQEHPRYTTAELYELFTKENQ